MTRAYFRPPDDDRPIPDGWETCPIEWNGREREVAFDPKRHVLLVARDGVIDDLEDRLVSAGYDYHGTDGVVSLWVRDVVAAARTALDRQPPGPEIGGLGR